MTDSPTPSTSRHHDDKCDKPERSDKTVLLVSESLDGRRANRPPDTDGATKLPSLSRVDVTLTSFRCNRLATIFHVIVTRSLIRYAVSLIHFLRVPRRRAVTFPFHFLQDTHTRVDNCDAEESNTVSPQNKMHKIFCADNCGTALTE